ncbi:MAG: GNAT family N-acetyltransferase [Planctomycetota bacterium]|jgi:phosphinothricin acetyltransferase
MPDIRLATIEDLGGILAISNWAAEHTAANFAIVPETPESWRSDWDGTHEMFPWLVATDDGGAVIGFAKASPWKGRCAYNWSAETTVYVHPDHHGRGLGTALYERLIHTLEAQGYRTLLGGITVPNPASVRLHESLGFRRVALLEQVGWKFDAWHDVGYWELKLHDEASPPGDIRPVADVI